MMAYFTSAGHLQPQLPDSLRLISSETVMTAIIMMFPKNGIIARKNKIKKITHKTKIIDWK